MNDQTAPNDAEREPLTVQMTPPLVPGSRVLVTLTDDLERESVEQFHTMLSKRFPGVEFTFVAVNGTVNVLLPQDTQS